MRASDTSRLRRLRHASWAVGCALLGLSVTACPTEVQRPPQTPLQSKPELVAIRVALDPNVGFVAKDGECAGQGASAPGAFREAARAALTKAGFTVVGDPSAPHDAVAKVSTEWTHCGAGWTGGVARLALEPGGSVEQGWPFACFGDPYHLQCQRETEAVDEAMRRLIDEPAIGALARAVRERSSTQATVAASAPAPPPAPAQPAAGKPVAAPTAEATQPATTPGLIVASPQPAAYALIVGVEGYRDVPAATGARRDAEAFAELARTTLGLRADHVRVATEVHATRTDILGGLRWLKENASPGSRVYFFFSGHGAPSPDSSTYLFPYDGDPRDIAGSGVSMAEVMKALGETKARDALAIVDSCFSGAGGRSVLPPGARPLMRVKETAPAAQMALFTASRGDEISGPAPGEAQGVFTKYVVQGLGSGQADVDGDGQVSLQELSDWVSPRVANAAKRDNREQHPTLVRGSGAPSARDFIVEYGLPTH